MHDGTQKKLPGKVSPESVQRTWTWDLKMREQHEPDQESGKKKNKQLIIRVIHLHIHTNLSGFNAWQTILPPETTALGTPVTGEVT